MRYPWWQYPIICLWLLHYLIGIKFRVKALIAWRKEIGVILRNHKSTLSDALSFGHWAVGQSMIGIWGKRG